MCKLSIARMQGMCKLHEKHVKCSLHKQVSIVVGLSGFLVVVVVVGDGGGGGGGVCTSKYPTEATVVIWAVTEHCIMERALYNGV